MNFPKLKNAMLCRIFPYIVVIGGFFFPAVVVCCLPFVPKLAKVLTFSLCCFGLVYYIIRNIIVLMGIDMCTALVHCQNKARTQYPLPAHRTMEQMEESISRYGRKCKPLPKSPQPSALRYRFQPSFTFFAKGIEKVVATYHVSLLDQEAYREIFNSATSNSLVLTGTVKPRFLDKEQKKAPLNRVTVIVIFAQRVEAQLRGRLYEEVCKRCGDEDDVSILPCVIDLEHRTCVFNSLVIPYYGFQYAVKNRGIRLVKRFVFGGRIKLAGNEHRLPPLKDCNPEDTLWKFWGDLRRELKQEKQKDKRQFEKMEDGEICLRQNALYLKYGNKGVCLFVSMDGEKRCAEVSAVDLWEYPKSNKISKKDIQELEKRIRAYFARQGYTVTFFPLECAVANSPEPSIETQYFLPGDQ